MLELSRGKGPWFFFVDRFLIADLIPLLMMVCADFLFPHDSVLVDYVFLEIYPFLLDYLNVVM